MATPNIYEVCAQYYDKEKKRFIRDALGFYTSKKKAEIDCNMLFMINVNSDPTFPEDVAFIVVPHEPNKLTTCGKLFSKDWGAFFEDDNRSSRYSKEFIEKNGSI